MPLIPLQGFDWDALASRTMPPPRKPKEEDTAKRKAELTEARKSEPREPTVTDEEVSEWERMFRDF